MDDVKKGSEPQNNNESSVDEGVKIFMDKYKLPGLSIALSKRGKIVFAKGYGYADIATKEEVTPFHLFRIASLSKPITSMAILKLVEENELSLDDKVFGENAIFGNDFTFSDPRIAEITLRQLMNHTSGGWKNDGNDPMFQYTDLNQKELIQKILNTRTLDHTPGTSYAYSNFGYCILGRVIEKISGISYEDYVRTHILEPIDISDMHIAGNQASDKVKGEVTYYSQERTSPYSMQVSRMDSHGGWIASSLDLLKLLMYMNTLESSASIQQMTIASSVNSGYALGWEVNQANNLWHTGALPGTASLMVKTNDGFCWSILVNSRSLEGKFFYNLDQLMWRIAREVDEWPEFNVTQAEN